MTQIEWGSLPFAYQKTNFNVRSYFRDGEWGKLEISDSEYISLHMAATGLHYGQQAFEGLKAYSGKDGKVRLFRWEENAQRMQDSANGILMAVPPKELFKEAVLTVVRLNQEFIPPHGTGASLYIRPLLFGSGPRVGVKPADEYMFLVFVSPVGPYFKEGFNPVSIMVARDYDRAAPKGTGCYKVGGNYAASLTAGEKAHKEGFASALFLDAREKKYIDEAGPANFFAIKGNTYITPLSESILPSITNRSLMTLAEDMGMKVERRKVALEELSEFDEVGACGTAAVISPIRRIVDIDMDMEWNYCLDSKAGPKSSELYQRLIDIQYGDADDKFGWTTVVDF
ncbi:MAG: branched-chain amino acid aminotransferase [Bacteroidota bacterium]